MNAGKSIAALLFVAALCPVAYTQKREKRATGQIPGKDNPTAERRMSPLPDLTHEFLWQQGDGIPSRMKIAR